MRTRISGTIDFTLYAEAIFYDLYGQEYVAIHWHSTTTEPAAQEGGWKEPPYVLDLVELIPEEQIEKLHAAADKGGVGIYKVPCRYTWIQYKGEESTQHEDRVDIIGEIENLSVKHTNTTSSL